MLVKSLGAIDLFGGFILVFENMINIHKIFFLIIGIILLIKSFLGGIPKDFGSLTDFAGGIVMIMILLIPFPYVISVILGLCLVQKGIFSFL